MAEILGHAHPGQVGALFERVAARTDMSRLAAHLHDTQAMGLANAYAALAAGGRAIDASVGGLGGCPFALGAAITEPGYSIQRTTVPLEHTETIMGIREDIPVLARHEGQWKGVYIHVDADGAIIDKHRSYLICRFPESGDPPYFQTNVYEWEDGRREELHFPAEYRDRRIWWDTERIKGQAWEIDDTTVVLTWAGKDLPGASLYEMIQISEDGKYRARTWHWFQDAELFKRTLIKEQRVEEEE